LRIKPKINSGELAVRLFNGFVPLNNRPKWKRIGADGLSSGRPLFQVKNANRGHFLSAAGCICPKSYFCYN